ncbi:gag-pol polyprotein [Tanacetum coccineum]
MKTNGGKPFVRALQCCDEDLSNLAIGLCYHYKELHCCAQCLIEDEDFDKDIAAEGNGNGNNRNQIRCYNCRGMGHLARNCIVRPRRMDGIDEIEEVNANCILMANLQQASTSGTQTDNALVYDSYRSTEVHEYDNCYNNEIFNMFTQEEQYTKLLEPIPEPYQVQQNDNDVISTVSSVEQDGRTVEQHPATVEETRAYFESLYNNLAIEVERVNTVKRKMKETNADLTTELARYKNQEKCSEINQEK